MSIKDIVTRPFVTKRLLSIGRNLSFSSQLLLVTRTNHLHRSEKEKVDFRSNNDSFGTASVKMCCLGPITVVFPCNF